MDMKGEERIPAPREVVWDALNDPEVLKACIPGCQTLEKTSDTSFSATVQAKVGPVKAKFAGDVTLTDIDPPNGYKISGEGKGGAAGFAKGGAVVSLAEDGGETVLTYEVDANVGGKLAQIGSRLIDSTAKKMAGEFFSKFNEEVAAKAGGAPAAEAAPAPAESTTEEPAEEATPAAPAPAAPSAETAAEPAPAPETKPAPEPAPATETEVKTAASKAATDAVDEVAAKRKGLSPVIWVVAVVVVAGLLIYGFNS
ncbi:SRPBCC family protein [Hwanghaeella sp.]|uniref:SRPBCC family protein n=1 Tax=Hwanghaeella sp. TaxID=2605943 RepID=UPI003CCC3E9F